MRPFSGAERQLLGKFEEESRAAIAWDDFVAQVAEELAENLAGPSLSREYIRERICKAGSIKGRKVA